jgi:hypothetical protein
VRKTAKKVRIKMEMTDLVAAIEQCRSVIGGGDYPPDGTVATDTTRFIKRAFPRWSNPSNPTLTPDTALVYWLAGPDGISGFSSNPTNPLAAGGGIGPFFTFAPDRLVASGAGYQYYPQNDQPMSSPYEPYLYFKAVAGQYTTTAPAAVPNGVPYNYQASLSSAASGFVYPTSFQLLCPGLDGQYGQSTGTPAWPAGANYDPVFGMDDMTNFTLKATVGEDISQ